MSHPIFIYDLNTVLIPLMFSSQNVCQRGFLLTGDSMKYYLKFLSGRNRVSLWERFLHLVWLRDQYWRKQKVTDFQCIYFSTHYSISNLLLTHLWTIYVDFVLIEVNTDCYTRSFDCVLPSLNKGTLISIDDFEEILEMGNWNHSTSQFLIFWLFFFCSSTT